MNDPIKFKITSKKLLVFDFFGVISSEVAVYWFAKFFDMETNQKIHDTVVAEGDMGDVDYITMFKNLEKVTGVSHEQILKEWLELAKIKQDTVKLIEEYKKKYKVILLSNAPGGYLRIILERENLPRLFDKMFISSDLHLCKPDKRIWEYALKEMNISPHEAVMIDDNEKNIKAANELGMDGIVFKGADDLRKHLEELGYKL